MEKLTHLLAGLSLLDNRPKYLAEVKPALSALSREEISAGIGSVELAVLFDCLNTQDKGQVENTCHIIRYLFGFMDPVLLLEKYGEIMRRGLSHPSPAVPVLVLQQLERCARDEEIAASHLATAAIFSAAVDCLGAEDLGTAVAASSLLVTLGEGGAGLRVVLANPTVAQLEGLCTKSETVKFRVLEVLVKISQISQEHLDRVSESGLLKHLLNLLQVEDILARLNAIEILTNLALTHQGFRYLEENNVLVTMEEMLNKSRNDPFSHILLPGYVKFFGNLAHLRPKQILLQHPGFVDSLFRMTESSDDLTLKAVAFETLGYIGESLEGKTTLASLGNKLTDCIERLETLIRDGPTEARIRGMNAFASLIRLDKENQTRELVELTEAWYRRAVSGGGAGPMHVLVGIVKQPFPDLRLGVYQLLGVMGKQVWGRREILTYPGFLEFLLDRSTEKDKDGKDARYALIVSLAEGGEAGQVVGQEVDTQLKDYVRQGPYHVTVESQVAFDNVN